MLEFPLFLGMSPAERISLAGTTRFDFIKKPAGKVIARAGDTCRELFFLTSGTVSVTTVSDDGAYSMEEELAAPQQFEMEALFGFQNRYAHTWRTLSECRLVRLPKSEIVRLTGEFLVVRLNLIGSLSTSVQKLEHRSLRHYPDDVRTRLVRFILDRSVYPAGRKTLRILMTRLALETGCSRLEVSQTLHQMESEGTVVMQRGILTIPSLERLLF